MVASGEELEFCVDELGIVVWIFVRRGGDEVVYEFEGDVNGGDGQGMDIRWRERRRGIDGRNLRVEEKDEVR